MASKFVYDALKALLQTEFSGVYPVLDFDDIRPDIEQDDEQAFLALEELVADEDVAGFGDPSSICMRERGTIVVYGFTPAPESNDAARSIIENVRDALRLRTFSGIRVQSVTPPDTDLSNDGLWTAASTAVSYERDSQHAKQSGA